MWYSNRAQAVLMFSLVPTNTKGTMPLWNTKKGEIKNHFTFKMKQKLARIHCEFHTEITKRRMTKQNKKRDGTMSKQTGVILKVLGGENWQVGDMMNCPFTSLLLAVSSPTAPCLPTSTRGSFLSLSPSIRTRTTPDLSTISWMTFPLLPMTLPAQKRRRLKNYYNLIRQELLK